jgi:hypothetical protein
VTENDTPAPSPSASDVSDIPSSIPDDVTGSPSTGTSDVSDPPTTVPVSTPAGTLTTPPQEGTTNSPSSTPVAVGTETPPVSSSGVYRCAVLSFCLALVMVGFA